MSQKKLVHNALSVTILYGIIAFRFQTVGAHYKRTDVDANHRTSSCCCATKFHEDRAVTMPEEINRLVTDSIADVLFALVTLQRRINT